MYAIAALLPPLRCAVTRGRRTVERPEATVTGRLYSKVQSLGGYMTLDNGRQLVFGFSMSGAIYPKRFEGLVQAGNDMADVAAAFQQSLSEGG